MMKEGEKLYKLLCISTTINRSSSLHRVCDLDHDNFFMMSLCHVFCAPQPSFVGLEFTRVLCVSPKIGLSCW